MKYMKQFSPIGMVKRVSNGYNVATGSTSLGRHLCLCTGRLPMYLQYYSHHPVKHFGLWGSSNPQNEWNKAVSEAEKIVGYPTSFMSLRCLLSDELSNVAMQMRKLVGTKHPLLKTARKFLYDGKHSLQTRGLLVLLVAKAAGQSNAEGSEHLEAMVSGIYPSQRSLAEITEMIHTANLIHKGVVNLSSLQPCDGSLKDMEFGNKMAVLSGDFLLANASTALAELENSYVVELISSSIGDLMKAEFTKFRDSDGDPSLPADVTIEEWKNMTFLSSGSLIAKSCKSALLLAHHPEEIQDSAFEFGKHISYCRQLHEDLQPFVNPSEDNNNNGINITSAPFVVHASKHKEDSVFLELLTKPPNTHKLVSILKNSESIQETRQLCIDHGQMAVKALNNFPMSGAKQALLNIIKALTTV